MEIKYYYKLWKNIKGIKFGINYIQFWFKYNQQGSIMIDGEFVLELEVVM
jgi:hypothetical protein